MKIDIRSKSFGDTPILGRISLEIGEGEILAITGPSGVGKTTLMCMLAGLDTNFEGRISDVGRVGFVFQEPTLLPWRNLLDNLTIVTGCTSETALAMLDRVGLRARAHEFPDRLSLGQQRRVGLARALATNPQTLILDEAFASLDEATAEKMRDLVRDIVSHGNFSTILVTHNLEEAVEMAGRVIALGGKPAEILIDQKIDAAATPGSPAAAAAILRARVRALQAQD